MGPKSTFQSDLRREFASTLLPTLWGPWGVLRDITISEVHYRGDSAGLNTGRAAGRSEPVRKGDGFGLEASRGSRALGTERGAGGRTPAVRKLEGCR